MLIKELIGGKRIEHFGPQICTLPYYSIVSYSTVTGDTLNLSPEEFFCILQRRTPQQDSNTKANKKKTQFAKIVDDYHENTIG
jgi:hypothetical protein